MAWKMKKEMRAIIMKKWLSIAVTAVLLAMSLMGCGAKKEGASQKASKEAAEATREMESPLETEAASQATETPGKDNSGELLSGKHHAEIEVKDYGTIKVELDADVAPISTANFLNLAKSGFYDGLTFHRIISGFMIQGGDPNGDGSGGSEETIKGEFESNGVENSISHKRGVISMARSNDPNSASSQFFLMHADSPYLDGEYAAFGHVTEGIEIVDQICDKVQPVDGDGTVEKENQPVIATVKAVD